MAIGFNIIYNTTGIINFAQGEFVMLGGMISISLLHIVPLPVAISRAVLITMIVGALIEIVFIRWLDSPSVLRMIIITIGLSILIREVALHIWGESIRCPALFFRQRNYQPSRSAVFAFPHRCSGLSECAESWSLGLSLFFKVIPRLAGK